MRTLDKVRQRRQERIRSIRYSGRGAGSERSRSHQAEPVPFDDPELAWKYRDNPWELHRINPNGDSWRPGGGYNPLTGELGGKLIVSAVLFALVWGLFQLEREWALPGQELVRQTLTEQSDFSTVAVWYETWFDGAPSFIPSFRDTDNEQVEKANASVSMAVFVPMRGETVLADAKQGIWRIIGSNRDTAVAAFAEGRVLAVEEGSNGYQIVIQHIDGYRTLYAGLADTSLAVHDWVRGGEKIGTPGIMKEKSSILFALKRDNKPLDPTDVVAFE